MKAAKAAKTATPTFTPEQTLDLAEVIYKLRLSDKTGGHEGAVERMIAKDKDDGEKLRNRAKQYAPLVRAMLAALVLLGYEITPPEAK